MRPQATWSFSWPFMEFPPTFQKPSAYLLAACNRQFASLLHAYAHDQIVIFVCSDATVAARVRTFAGDLLMQMRKDSQTFRLMESEHLIRARCLSSPPGSVGRRPWT